MKIPVYYLLRSDAKLVVRFFPTQIVKSLFAGVNALKIKIDGIENLIIGNASFYDVEVFVGQALTTCRNIIKPFPIISRKHFAADIAYFFR